jgi:hypothetical protein
MVARSLETFIDGVQDDDSSYRLATLFAKNSFVAGN